MKVGDKVRRSPLVYRNAPELSTTDVGIVRYVHDGLFDVEWPEKPGIVWIAAAPRLVTGYPRRHLVLVESP